MVEFTVELIAIKNKNASRAEKYKYQAYSPLTTLICASLVQQPVSISLSSSVASQCIQCVTR